MAAKIGIKLADGTFFPIMDDDFSASETLELTTVRDDQRSVQINLFKKEDDAAEPLYIGSLIVEDIQAKPAGEPTIELRLALDDEKNLSAEAVDKDSGSHQTLRVSLETFEDQSFTELDFDLNAETADADIDLTSSSAFDTDEQQAFSASTFYTDEDNEQEESKKKRGFPIWLLIVLILLGVAALTLGILLLTKKSFNEDTKLTSVDPAITTVKPTSPIPEPPPAPSLPSEPAVTEPPIQSDKTEPPVTPAPQEQPAVKEPPSVQASPAVKGPAASATPEKTIRYQLRWGDTLWDLSETFYRNPWLYTKIATHNKLKNPDLIISGTYIEIPPQ